MTRDELLQVVDEVLANHLARLPAEAQVRLRHLTAEAIFPRVLARLKTRQALLRSSPPNGDRPAG